MVQHRLLCDLAASEFMLAIANRGAYLTVSHGVQSLTISAAEVGLDAKPHSAS